MPTRKENNAIVIYFPPEQVEWAERVFGKKAVVLCATHTDRGHIHNVRPDRAIRKAV